MAEQPNELMRQLGKAKLGNESQAVRARDSNGIASPLEDRRTTSMADERDNDELNRAVDGCKRCHLARPPFVAPADHSQAGRDTILLQRALMGL